MRTFCPTLPPPSPPQEKMEKLKEDSAPQIKLLKAATPGPKKDGAKDEV